MEENKKIQKTAEYLKNYCFNTKLAVVLGSGLSGLANELIDFREISYENIPGFPVSTVPGHQGKLIFGNISGKNIMLMSGRFHSYEGYSLAKVTFPIRVMKMLGIESVILTNAAGGVNPDIPVGSLMLINDFINLSGKNPLRGTNIDALGPRFPDMTNAYSIYLRRLAHERAKALDIPLYDGVYCWMNGPSYETPAEIRMIRTLGADAVGMSTVPETIVARHMNMNVLGISCITNHAAGVSNMPINHEEVIETGKRVQTHFIQLIESIIERLDYSEIDLS